MKRILVIVDMQNDFIFQDCALGTAEAETAYGKLCDYLATTTADYNYIVFTRDTHYTDYLDTAEGKKLPVEHCIRNTGGWDIRDGLVPENYNFMMNWDKYTFGAYDLPEKLHDMFYSFVNEPTEIELVGLCTDICVVSNALLMKAHFYDECEISVDATCCAGVTPESHEAALKTMEMCQINVKR
jgi:nicotinamidase-related amidase